jgi:hypothetical protein
MQFLSATEYFRPDRDGPPPQRWQACGFLADLDVTP